MTATVIVQSFSTFHRFDWNSLGVYFRCAHLSLVDHLHVFDNDGPFCGSRIHLVRRYQKFITEEIQIAGRILGRRVCWRAEVRVVCLMRCIAFP